MTVSPFESFEVEPLLKKRDDLNFLLLEAYAELGLGQPARARKLFLEIMDLEPGNAAARQEFSRLNDANAVLEKAHA